MIKSAFSGSVLVASGAIGAGMFSLPVVTAGAWTSWSLAGLLLVWVATLFATLLLARLNLDYPPGASFGTLVDDILGSNWGRVNGVAVWFVLAILLYAYFSASGSITHWTLQRIGITNSLPQSLTGLLFGAVIALMVWSGSRLVSGVCTLLLLGMTIAFSLVTGGMLIQMDISSLAHLPQDSWRYAWYPLPYFVTAFACAGLVPSLVKHYAGQRQPVLNSILIGTTITLVVYLIWLAVNFGNLSRGEFAQVIAAGGNMGALVAALQANLGDQSLSIVLTLFSNLAITTSFLSIALGLFDYLSDRFGFTNNAWGRTKTAILTFAPPAILSFMYPRGFVLAIGYAGLAVLFCFFVIPLLMATRKEMIGYKAKILLAIFISLVLVSKLTSVLGIGSGYPV